MSILVLLSQKLAAFVVMITAMEYLVLRRQFTDQGVWSWSVVGQEFSHYPRVIKTVLNFFLSDRSIVPHFVVRLGLGCALLFADELQPLLLAALWLSTVLIAIRMRGTFNGGSDVMTAVVLACLALGNTQFGIYYLAVQVAGSYVVAGFVKLKNAEWRNGTALPHFMQAQTYGAPKWAQILVSKRFLSVSLSWFIILFECSFPIAFLSRELCALYLCLGLGFHLMNFFILGLNRFFWIWLSAYPVIYSLAQVR